METLLEILKPFSPLLIAVAAPNFIGLAVLVLMLGVTRSNFRVQLGGKTKLRQLQNV